MSYKNDINFMWESVKIDLAEEIDPHTVELCFGEVSIDSFDGNELVLSTPSYIRHKQILKDYLELLEEKFKSYLGYKVKITVNYTGESTEEVRKRILRQIQGLPPEEEAQPKKSAFVGGTLPPFNFEYTFDNFIVGNSNKFAHAACWAVSERPAMDYNPLFIYGPSGLGKTHLLYAITNAMKKKNPDLRVIYIKGEDFTNQMIESLAEQSMSKFRNKYRSCDMLLIDDIQFIAGKVSTQEEFFHTFNALFEDRKQIILTSDRPPRDIKTLEERLKTRFEWGLIADIQPPDMELRVAIIKKKAEQVNVILPEDVLTFLSENLRSNIRQIEGAIKKLGAMSFLSGRKITMELAKGCISELLGGAEPTSVTVDKVFSAIYKRYNIKKEEIIGTRRTKEIAAARHLSVYLVRTITEMSLPNIGKIFNRDHSTILSSIEAAEKKLRNDPILEIEIAEMIKEITDQK
ncbi:MAG: chromosomal replication initiator protein DnaA [Ruminococcaceae bacterium]|nr:chromosomal replication initiator protein DnaA [Oscillospiraceae bacterium]